MLYQEFKEKYLPLAQELEKVTRTYEKAKQPQYSDVANSYENSSLTNRIVELVWATISRKPFSHRRENLDFFDLPIKIEDKEPLDADISSCANYAVYKIASELRARTIIDQAGISRPGILC